MIGRKSGVPVGQGQRQQQLVGQMPIDHRGIVHESQCFRNRGFGHLLRQPPSPIRPSMVSIGLIISCRAGFTHKKSPTWGGAHM